MTTYNIQRTGSCDTIATASSDDAARRLADEICENIRQEAIARDGIDPGFNADDVTIVKVEG